MRLCAFFPAVLTLVSMSACAEEPTDEEKFQANIQRIRAETMRQAMADYERSEAVFGKKLTSDPIGGLAACEAAIGELMSQSPAIIKTSRKAVGLYELRYKREDGTLWAYRCRAAENELQWATLENGSQGNWRGGEHIRYKVNGETLTLTLQDFTGDDYLKKYDLSSLKELK